MRILQNNQYKCTIKFRQGECNDSLEGQTMLLKAHHIMRDGEEYPGEYVMIPVYACDYNLISSHGLSFIPSGNLKFNLV